jgi:hypothetical protein
MTTTETQPKTQPHYGGWDLPRNLWRSLTPLPEYPDCDYWRMDIPKRLYRYGFKGDKARELEKIEACLNYLERELPGGVFRNVEQDEIRFVESKVIQVFSRSQGGYNSMFIEDRLRIAMAFEAFMLGQVRPVSQGIERMREYAEGLRSQIQPPTIANFVSLED